MKVLCVQCMKLNELPESSPAADGKVKFSCPNCAFVTVVTRKAARKVAPPPPAEDDPPTEPARPRGRDAEPTPEPRREAKNLHDELFDGSDKEIGDWMVRRLEERYVPAAFHELTAELFNELDMASVSPPRK